ncbi:MAG: AraC family transcriptional regulator [Ruminococcaceae bacterium]|nr:AraC family transcriptional regulator [Oscillospiraceae bacterium]
MSLSVTGGGVKINPFTVSRAGDIEAERSAIHEEIELKCFVRGSATLLIGDRAVSVSAGDIVVINPYQFHATISAGEDPGIYHLIMVSPDYFYGAGKEGPDLRKLLFGEQLCFSTLVRDEKLFELLCDAARESGQGGKYSDMAVQGILFQSLACLLRDHALSREDEKPASLRAYKLMEPALRRIRDSFSEKITVDELASLCGLSKHYFCRVFHSVTGRTVMEYLGEYRMTVADTLLAGTDKSVTEIAALCGFESTNYFCRCYKKRFGFSPSRRRGKE